MRQALIIAVQRWTSALIDMKFNFILEINFIYSDPCIILYITIIEKYLGQRSNAVACELIRKEGFEFDSGIIHVAGQLEINI
jgi:hypothetical protein